MPAFSEDDVLDFMVAEAVVLRELKQERDEQEEQRRREWKDEVRVGKRGPR